jgi:hypothetical protein
VPAVTALVTLDEVKTHLHISTDVHDDQIQGFIDAATAYIQGLTGPIVAQSFTETHCPGGEFIVVYHPPVLTVESIVEYVGPNAYPLTQVDLADGAGIGTYSFTIDNARGGILRRRWNGGIPGRFVGNDVIVSYTGGQGSVPADVRMATLQDISGLWQPSQNNSNPYGSDADLGNAPPTNPVNMFPRVAAILSGPSTRVPGIG